MFIFSMYFYFISLKWYCWKKGLRFYWNKNISVDKGLIALIVMEPGNDDNCLILYMSKKPCKKMNQICNHLKFLTYQKMFKKREKIEKHIVDFGRYKVMTFC